MKNFCLLIVTNRENFLKNIFNFYQNCNFKIVIAHNIKSEINYIPNKNIQLIYINENMAFKRISKAIKHIKERYFMLFSDDDFVFSDTIKKSVGFLESNNQFSNAHGIQLSMKIIERKIVTNENEIDLSAINFFEDSKYIYKRIFNYFTNKYDDKIFSILEKKLFIDILDSFEFLNEYPVALEQFANICICLSGRTKIFNEIGWLKREHELNAHKSTELKSFDSMVLEIKFLKLFKKSIQKFCKIRNINKSSIYFIFLFLFMFRFKIYLIGNFKFVRSFFSTIRKNKRKKLERISNQIFRDAKPNLQKVEKIL